MNTSPEKIKTLIYRLKHETWSGFQGLAEQAGTTLTEQATEIAELKAKLAEVMPLAKVGALVARKHIAVDDGKLILPAFDSHLTEQLYEEVFTQNIEATIEQLLKD